MEHLMSVLDLLSDLVQILNEAHKLSSKNKKLMFFIMLVYPLISSIFYLINLFSIKPLITDFITKQNLLLTSLGSPEFATLVIRMQKEIKMFIGVEWIFLIISSIASLFFTVAIIFASAVTYGGSNIPIKDLLVKTVKSWRRPFFTCFYIILLNFGYFSLLFVILFPIVLSAPTLVSLQTLTIALTILAQVFGCYLAVMWNSALVVSVLEEKFGMEAFGKAAQIVKGMQLQGFLLNLLFAILYSVLSQGIKFIGIMQSTGLQIIIGLLVIISMALVRMFSLMVYTVFYYHCKQVHGEEVEFQESVGYTKIPM